MKNKIYLKFDSTISGLAGFDYGAKVYNEQVNGGQDFDTVVFPKQIELVATSFTQGFFKDLIEKYGADYVREHYKIESDNEKVAMKVKGDIY